MADHECDNGWVHYQHPLKPAGVPMTSVPCEECNPNGDRVIDRCMQVAKDSEVRILLKRWSEDVRSISVCSENFEVRVHQSYDAYCEEHGTIPQEPSVGWASYGSVDASKGIEMAMLLEEASWVAAKLRRCSRWYRFDASHWKGDGSPVAYVTVWGVDLVPQGDESVVHILHHGSALCGHQISDGHKWMRLLQGSKFPEDIPEEIPDDHRWCEPCQFAAKNG